MSRKQPGTSPRAVPQGAGAELAPDGHAAGAELVQLRGDSSGGPKVQPQDGPPDDAPFFALEQLRRSVRTIVREEVVATASASACGYCQFRRVCPAPADGQSILVRQREARPTDEARATDEARPTDEARTTDEGGEA